MVDKIKIGSKAHTRYKTSDGKLVPGTTTVTSLLNKPHLVAWANRLGLEGIDSSKYRDGAAEVGTLAHAMIQEHLLGDEVDFDQYSQRSIDLATRAVASFFAWENQHDIELIMSEHPLVSDELGYGGTIDCYCVLDGIPTLVDFKTGKAIYDDYFIQLAAYRHLLEEHGHPVKQCRILRIGRDATEGFEERVVSDTDKYFEIFKHLLGVYNLKKELKLA
ncbi:MAG: PD-(D/E)XK nuclease family protein [Peptococcaceae bacterium]|nr:PD-(D/E)XK nuclease family protein [Peptococcaceae bacterium]